MNKEISKINNYVNDEIDISKLLNLIFKEKKIISLLSFFSFISCIFIYLNIKPSWLGRFQIVVREDKSIQEQLKGPQILSTFSGLVNQGQRTQELILKSPSVLMPVYEFNKEYSAKYKVKIKDKSFDEWFKNSFNVFFEKGSKILTIEYKSTDKELIKKTLNLVSDKYQNYSKKNKDRYLKNIINYLNNQKEYLTKKSYKSFKEFNNFTIENRLASVDGFVELGNQNYRDLNISNILNNKDISNINLSNSDDSSIEDDSGQRFNGQFKLLDKYETEYLNLSSVLKPESRILKDLRAKIDTLRESLKRPNEILTKYRELRTIALRDERNLSSVSGKLDSYKIEQALQPLPWDLISKPSINEDKIFPNFTFFLTINLMGIILVNSLYLIIKNFLKTK